LGCSQLLIPMNMAESAHAPISFVFFMLKKFV
jgi:hypothetical protein